MPNPPRPLREEKGSGRKRGQAGWRSVKLYDYRGAQLCCAPWSFYIWGATTVRTDHAMPLDFRKFYDEQ